VVKSFIDLHSVQRAKRDIFACHTQQRGSFPLLLVLVVIQPTATRPLLSLRETASCVCAIFYTIHATKSTVVSQGGSRSRRSRRLIHRRRFPRRLSCCCVFLSFVSSLLRELPLYLSPSVCLQETSSQHFVDVLPLRQVSLPPLVPLRLRHGPPLTRGAVRRRRSSITVSQRLVRK